jgi:hypothetical protein
VVQNIEHFCAELQFERLANWEIAVYREIPLGCTESSQRISA